MLRRSVLSVFAAFVLIACGDDGGGGGDSSTVGDTTAGDGSGGTAIVDADLIGSWSTDCVDQGGGIYSTNTFIYNGGGSTGTYRQWTDDPTCSDDASFALSTAYEDASLTLGAAVPAGTELDRIFTSHEVTLARPDIVTIWNDMTDCGPFELDVPRDTAGLTCFGISFPESGGTLYDLITLDGDGGLLAGDPATGDRLTPDTRPTAPYAPAVFVRD